MTRIRSWAPKLAWVVCVSWVVACSHEETGLLVGSDTSPRHDEESLRRRMNVRLHNEALGWVELTPDAFQRVFIPTCLWDSEGSSVDWDLPGGSCEADIADIESAQCIANQLIQVIESPSETEVRAERIYLAPPLYSAENEVLPFVIPPQSQATNTALARIAYELAVFAADTAADAVGNCGDLDLELYAVTSGDSVGSHTRGAYVASALGESYDTALHAARLAQRSAMAVSDAYRSEFPDPNEAAWAAYRVPFANRAWAAGLMLGAPVESDPAGAAFQSRASEGFCPGARLSGEATEAERLLRLSGVSPIALFLERLDDAPEIEIPIDDLIAGFDLSAFGLGMDSVAGRLALLTGETALSGATAEQFYAHYGLTREAFQDARRRIVEELAAFQRPFMAEDAPQLLAAGYTTEGYITLYASTRNEPQLPPPAYWATLLRYDETPDPFTGFTEIDGSPRDEAPPEPTVGTPVTDTIDVAGFVDWWNTRIPQLATDAGDPMDPTATQELLSRQAAMRAGERRGRIRACWYGAGGEELDEMSSDLVRFDAYGDFGTLYVVAGHAGLQCAVRGDVEGAPCDLTDYLVAVNSGMGFSARTPLVDTGFTTAQRGSILARNAFAGFPASPYFEGVTAYIVERRAGDQLLPGALHALGGFQLRVPDADMAEWRYCLSAPLVPEMEESTASLLAPDPTFCAQSADSCAGIPYNQRIPLENELTSDGDALESSWRHYLTLARDAADHADLLGENLIRTGMQMDEQIEAAAAQLEQICGVSIGVRSIRALTETPASTGECNMMGECDDPRYVCRAESCVLDVFAALEADGLAQPDAARLRDCVGVSGSVDWAALGNRRLCLWVDNITGALCTNADPEVACPWFADADGTCDFTFAPSMGVTNVTVDEALGVFPAPEDITEVEQPLDSADYPCAALARVRSGVESARWDVWGSSFMTQRQFEALSLRLGWEPSAGDFSRVTFDGATVFSTGTTSSGPGSLWPCQLTGMSGEASSLCPDDGLETTNVTDHEAPLFCMHSVCSDRLERARTNDLLARAVIAARVLGGQSLAGLRVPYYPRAEDPGVRIEGSPGWSTPRTSMTTLSSAISTTGSLGIDRAGDPGTDYATIDFAELGAYAHILRDPSSSTSGCSITGVDGYEPLDSLTIPAGAEWTACAYDRGGCSEVFDDRPDCDDPTSPDHEDEWRAYDRDLPLLVRTLPAAVAGYDAPTYAARFWEDWGEDGPTDLHGLVWNSLLRADAPGDEIVISSRHGHFEPNDRYPLSFISYYWRRSGCGTLGGGNCDFSGDSTAGRDATEEGVVERQAGICYRNDMGSCSALGCFQPYDDCVSQANSPHEVDFRSTFDGNRAFIASRGLTRRDLLNGMELLCAASRDANVDLNFGCAEPPPISNIQSMLQASSFLECKADAIRETSAMMIVRGLPQRVVELLRGGSGGSVGGVGGEYRAAVSRLRNAFIELRQTNQEIGDEVEGMGTEMRDLRIAVSRSEISHQIEDLTLGSQIADRVTSCVVAVGNAIANSGSGWGAAGSWTSASASCTNASIQIGITAQISDLRHQGLTLDTEQAFVDFEREYNARARNLSRLVASVQGELEQIDAALAELETLQGQGQRALAAALFLDSDETGRHYAGNTATRARYDTDLARYTEAQRRAVQLAFIAKLALEQRLGMPLDTMTEDLLTVEAPARWHMNICSMPAIDYDDISRPTPMLMDADAGTVPPTEETPRPAGYSGSYVGDYVRRLEQVFESYNFRYPFQDGTDTAVFSVRDDIHGIRRSCPVDVPNYLYHAGHPDVTAPPGGVGWIDEGCTDWSEWPEEAEDPAPVCITTRPIGIDDPTDPEASPRPPAGRWVVGPDSPDFGHVPAFRIEFGSTDARQPDELEEAEVAVTEDTRRVQWIRLPAGDYRVSWAVPASSLPLGGGPPEPDPALIPGGDAVIVIDQDDTLLFTDSFALASTTGVTGVGYWTRYYRFFSVPSERLVGVAVTPAYGESEPGYRYVDIGAFMVEAVPPLADETPSGPFFDTSDTRERMLEVCEDVRGEAFRDRAWERNCVRECPDGYDGTCPERLARNRCFYETTFDVGSDFLQTRLTGSPAGFASGNFNYRIETIAVNLVGTNLRDCDPHGPSTPSTCYASGSVSFSMLHDGPYLVRNHRGQLYDAPLFYGRMESARALMAERYITNPISSADQALVMPYARTEFRGRPLGGSFSLRIWDDQGFRFDRLEDVQLVLSYRYWTRQE